jgi:fucose permease
VAAAVFAALAVTVSRFLLAGPERADPAEAAAVPAPSDPAPRPTVSCRLRYGLGIAALGVIATLAQAIEDTGSTWSAVYLRDGLGAVPAVAGLGFVALQAMQTVGRLVGDRTVTRFSDATVARAGAALSGVGVAAALAVPSTPGTIAGFGVAGLGIATLIPAAMRHADGLPGLAPGVGLTLVGTVSRVGSLGAPPLIGWVADTWSLRVGLVAVPVAAAAVILFSGALRGVGARAEGK